MAIKIQVNTNEATKEGFSALLYFLNDVFIPYYKTMYDDMLFVTLQAGTVRTTSDNITKRVIKLDEWYKLDYDYSYSNNSQAYDIKAAYSTLMAIVRGLPQATLANQIIEEKDLFSMAIYMRNSLAETGNADLDLSDEICFGSWESKRDIIKKKFGTAVGDILYKDGKVLYQKVNEEVAIMTDYIYKNEIRPERVGRLVLQTLCATAHTIHSDIKLLEGCCENIGCIVDFLNSLADEAAPDAGAVLASTTENETVGDTDTDVINYTFLIQKLSYFYKSKVNGIDMNLRTLLKGAAELNGVKRQKATMAKKFNKRFKNITKKDLVSILAEGGFIVGNKQKFAEHIDL